VDALEEGPSAVDPTGSTYRYVTKELNFYRNIICRTQSLGDRMQEAGIIIHNWPWFNPVVLLAEIACSGTAYVVNEMIYRGIRVMSNTVYGMSGGATTDGNVGFGMKLLIGYSTDQGVTYTNESTGIATSITLPGLSGDSSTVLDGRAVALFDDICVANNVFALNEGIADSYDRDLIVGYQLLVDGVAHQAGSYPESDVPEDGVSFERNFYQYYDDGTGKNPGYISWVCDFHYYFYKGTGEGGPLRVSDVSTSHWGMKEKLGWEGTWVSADGNPATPGASIFVSPSDLDPISSGLLTDKAYVSSDDSMIDALMHYERPATEIADAPDCYSRPTYGIGPDVGALEAQT